VTTSNRAKIPDKLRRVLSNIQEGGSSPGGAVAWADVTGKPATFPPESHTHPTSAVTGLDTALSGKASTTHTHSISDTTGLQTALDGKQAAGSYAAATHTHATSDVTGLDTALSGKQATLVSGTNIKTINSTSILGSGNIVVSGGGSPLTAWFI
jgi:hypothetical protein